MFRVIIILIILLVQFNIHGQTISSHISESSYTKVTKIDTSTGRKFIENYRSLGCFLFLIESGYIENNEKVGLWTSFGRDGKPIRIVEYKNGKIKVENVKLLTLFDDYGIPNRTEDYIKDKIIITDLINNYTVTMTLDTSNIVGSVKLSPDTISLNCLNGN